MIIDQEIIDLLDGLELDIKKLKAERDRFRDHYPTDHRLDFCVCGESWTENHDGRTK